MKRFFAVPVALSVALAGCVDTAAVSPAVQVAVATAEPNSSAATWQMPWQLSPIASGSAANGEETTYAIVPQTGIVRGTPAAIAAIGRPLLASAEPNRTVVPCRDTVQGEARKAGARDVEAVSAGPERLDRKGQYFAPVKMRITYASLGIYEVREATLTCIVDRKGNIVDAYS